MQLRLAQLEDLSDILSIYESAIQLLVPNKVLLNGKMVMDQQKKIFRLIF
ncbi:hypothetical protein V4S31_00020 [Enterococcus cecorum]